MRAALLAVCCFVATVALGAERSKPTVKADAPAGGCSSGWCTNLRCDKQELWYVCTFQDEDGDEPDELYRMQCTNTATYYATGSNCCVASTVCCRYRDANGHQHTYYDDNSYTMTCQPDT